MEHLKRFICLIFSLVVMAGLCAADGQTLADTPPDHIVPKSGDLISGTFQSADGAGITFALDSGATTTISWDKVHDVVLHHKVKLTSKLTLRNGCNVQVFENPRFQIKNQTLVVAGAGSNSEQTVILANLDSVSSADEVQHNPPDKAAKVKLTGSILPKASLSTGTQGQQMWGAIIDPSLILNPQASTWHHQQYTLTLQANDTLATQVGSPSIRTHEYDGEFTPQIYLSKRVFAQIVAFGYHNSVLNLYLQQRYGGGIGGQVFSNCRHTLTLGGNLVFIGEHFYGNVPSLGFPGATLRESYKINLAKVNGNEVYISQVITYIPAFGQTKAWQQTGKADLNFPISKKLSASLSYANDYMENAPSVRRNWSTSSVGFTYKFNP
jgi:hypothetical protein